MTHPLTSYDETPVGGQHQELGSKQRSGAERKGGGKGLQKQMSEAQEQHISTRNRPWLGVKSTRFRMKTQWSESEESAGQDPPRSGVRNRVWVENKVRNRRPPPRSVPAPGPAGLGPESPAPTHGTPCHRDRTLGRVLGQKEKTGGFVQSGVDKNARSRVPAW